MGIFKKFKIKTIPAPPRSNDDDNDQGVPLHIALDMVESLKWIEKVKRGEAEPMGSFEDLIAELKAEAQKEVELV